MEFHHIPVLFDEVMEWMQPRADGVYADGTLGGGGHSEGILRLSGGTATLYGIDRDEDAIRAAGERLKGYPGFHAIHGNFHDAKALLAAAGAPPLTGALLDLGVSSHQLDEGDRGFSYHEDAPLDMRMDQSTGLTAAEYLAQVTPEEFRRILTDYGEEKWAARIAQIFAEKRAQKPIQTTADLVAVVDAAIPKAVRRKDDGHPARRTFQAVRIAVNDELAPLENALRDFVELLAPGGRLLVAVLSAFCLGMIPRTSTIKELFICEPCFAVDIDIHVHIGTFGADVYDVAFPGIVCDQRLILIDLS